MDATSPYRTAAELGILAWEREALIGLVGPLARAELPDFDMRRAGFCIGGQMWRHRCGTYGTCHYIVLARSPALDPLFFPTRCCSDPHPAWSASQPQAAKAVVNLLTLGTPRWDDVVGLAPAAERPRLEALQIWATAAAIVIVLPSAALVLMVGLFKALT